MTQSLNSSPNPFDVSRQGNSDNPPAEQARSRRLSLPLRMDDGTVRTFDLPSSLERPSQFSTAEFERLTRAYAEALGLLPNK
jgi:hypothetical protein